MKTICAYCEKVIDRRPCRIKEHNYCCAKHQLLFEYANKIRDKFKITIKANQAVRKFGQPKLKGKPSWSKGLTKLDHPSIMKISLSKMGSNNPMFHKYGKEHHGYRGGNSTLRKKMWGRCEYKKWRKAVFEYDKYACWVCGDNSGGNLTAHHLKSWKDYPKLRYETSNGITVCEKCHTLYGHPKTTLG